MAVPSVTQFQPKVCVTNATLPSGAATPAAGVDLKGTTLCGIFLPAELDGTALTFTACDTIDGTYVPVIGSDGNAISYTVAASKYIAVDHTKFIGLRYIKPVMGTNQSTTDTVVKLASRAL